MEMVTGKWEGLEGLQDGTILVTAHDQVKVREIALKYGFKNVVTPGDILTAQPKIWPFSSLLEPYYRSISRPLPADPLKVDAILVFSDPFDWALDTQIIMDLLLSKDGVLGTYSEKNGDPSLPNRGYLQDGQPKLVFSNPDLWWASGYPLPRLGQGGFRTALQGVWDASTDCAKLDKTVIGKPSRHTYLFAERVLQHHREDLLGKKHGEVGPLKKVFMVGDNPASDIKGANEFESPHGTSWDSVLVRTGVYQEGRPLNEKPKHLVDGVREGVMLALREMGYQFDPKELED
jgi:HAD superfamily hydrolase (TIGR01456 family)